MELFTKAHSIGKTIAALRKEKGWTQVDLAGKLQVSDKAVSKWEKDDAFPSMEFFPALAELFNVSIDYLMTGKNPEPQVVTMSKAELCAKNNKLALVKEIDCTHRDENGKTLIDYIVMYECLDVFVELCTINKNNIRKFKIVDAVKFCILSNRLDLLTNVSFQLNSNVRYEFDTAKDILGLLPERALEHFGNKQGIDKYACILPNAFFKMLLTDKRIKKDTLDFILGTQADRTCVWYHAFPYLIHQCYENGNKEMLSRLLTITKDNNNYAYSNLTNNQIYAFNYFFIGFYNSKNGHGLIRILEETTKLALDRGDFELVADFNAINSAIIKYQSSFKCYVASRDEIRIAKLKLDKSVSATDIAIQSTIHNGIVCIDELMAINDFNIFKNTLAKHPIHIIEALMDMLQNNKFREIYQFAVDENDSSLAAMIIKEDIEGAKKHIVTYWRADKYDINARHLFIFKKNRCIDFYSATKTYSEYKTIDSILAFFEECKQRIINDLSLKLDKEKTIGDLTKDYFEKELAKGNIEIVIIKLCVRLEAILRSDYHYEGDFADLLKRYCEEKLTWQEDDGWGYMERKSDDKTRDALNKLRIKRNSIVHSEKGEEELSIDEIRFCIDYICKMG